MFSRKVRTGALILAALSLAATSAIAGKSVSQAPKTSTGEKEAVRRSFDAWAAGTGSPYDLLARNVRWTIVGRSVASKTYEGREAFLSEVIRPFNARMLRPLKPVVHGLYADGDLVIVRFDAEGTARDGQLYRNSYSWHLQMQGGEIISATAFFDSIEFNELWARVAPEE